MTFVAVLNPDSSDSWLDATHSLEEYNNPNGDQPSAAEVSMGQDAYTLAYGELGSEADNYDMLIVVNNIQMQSALQPVHIRTTCWSSWERTVMMIVF